MWRIRSARAGHQAHLGPLAVVAVLLAIATGLIFTVRPTQAAQISTFKTGNWNAGAYSDSSGRFSHCAANARYKSGIMLLFSVTRSGKWSMGFANGNWNLARGSRYPVAYQVDQGPIYDGVAIAKSARLVQVFLPTNSRVFNNFRYGNLLKVKAAKQLMKFNLTDTSKLLRLLLGCARHYVKKEGGGGNPFDSGGAGNPFEAGVGTNPFAN